MLLKGVKHLTNFFLSKKKYYQIPNHKFLEQTNAIY